jgi:hypothetical protein
MIGVEPFPTDVENWKFLLYIHIIFKFVAFNSYK